MGIDKEGIEEPNMDRRYHVYSSMAFVILIAFFGLPVWWISTSVYRAPLPYNEIGLLESAILTLPVSITIVSGDETVMRFLGEQNAASRIKEAMSKDLGRLEISLQLDERGATPAEKSVLKTDFHSFSELEDQLEKVDNRLSPDTNDGVRIFILHRPGISRKVHFGSGARIFVTGDLESSQRHKMIDLLMDVILHGYLRVDDWISTVARHMKEDVRRLTKSTAPTPSNNVLYPKMTLELHVVIPEPDDCLRRFPMDEILRGAVDQFLSNIKEVTEVTVKSQMLYGIDFNSEPIQDTTRGDAFYYLDPSQLQHIINPLETYLSTVVTAEPVRHMVIYIPRSENRPLKVVDRDLNPKPHNTFVVSGWGSVTVVNENHTCTDHRSPLIDPDAMKAMKTAIIANLRNYFGLQLPSNMDRSPSPLSEWEVQSLRYRAVVEYSFASMRSLSSLTKLLGEITNIVINDQIGARIDSSVSEMQTVLDAASTRSNDASLRLMLRSAAHAFDESEKAFFDPSLLALLYFPDDQKYAVYVPLFLPIGVPVVSSVLFIYKHFKDVFGTKKVALLA